MKRSLSRSVLLLHERFTGRHIFARLENLNRTQWFSRDELLTLQHEKLFKLVEYANRYVPYYQHKFKEVGFQPDDLRHDIDNLTKIPVLTKDIIRNNWNDLLTTELKLRKHLSELCTSGSTGEPLVFMQDTNFRDAVTADVQRHLGWAGCDLGDNHALIWCAAAKPSLNWKVRTGLIDLVWNRFRLNAYSMTKENMTTFAKRVRQKKPKILFGFPSDLHLFAQFIRQSSYTDIYFNGIFSTAETLIPPVRSFIEETFHCKVFDRYGTFELGGVGCECEEHNGYHVSAENNYVEILVDGYAANPGEVGDIIVTNLNNWGMPFIRYDIRDIGSWQNNGDCACGRASPKMKSLEGRIRDAFLTRDGRTIFTGFSGHAFHCLAQPGIRQFQVIQKTLDRILVRLVSDRELSETNLEEIIRAFKGTFGENVVVDFEVLDDLPKLPSGKHQYLMSEINNC